MEIGIEITHLGNLETLVIDEASLELFDWKRVYMSQQGKAVINNIKGSRPQHLFVHKLVYEHSNGKTDKRIYHKDRNYLNCRLNNLTTDTSLFSQPKFKGVSKAGKNFKVKVTFFGTTYVLGIFKSAIVAAHVYNTAVKQVSNRKVKLNKLPRIVEESEVVTIEGLKPDYSQISAEKSWSAKGVYKVGKNYFASISVDGETKYLGTFFDPADAEEAYNRAYSKYILSTPSLNLNCLEPIFTTAGNRVYV